jgi:hypothetical protein
MRMDYIRNCNNDYECNPYVSSTPFHKPVTNHRMT